MKYLTVLLAFVLASGAAFAVDRPERDRNRADAMIERIRAALEGGELSERRQAYLEHRLSYLELHKEIREAVRDAITELGADATREERKAAMESVRATFSEQLDDLKDARRDAVKKRRHLRGAEEADGAEG